MHCRVCLKIPSFRPQELLNAIFLFQLNAVFFNSSFYLFKYIYFSISNFFKLSTKTIHPLSQFIQLPKRVNYHLLFSYESISFTNTDTILLSALPANALFAAPITLPISAGEVAPTLAMMSFNATRISSSLII